jgi:hypothetical protein
LLVGDAEARRYAKIPAMSSWLEWCDFEEEHPEMDFTYDHLADYQQASLFQLPSSLDTLRSGSLVHNED